MKRLLILLNVVFFCSSPLFADQAVINASEFVMYATVVPVEMADFQNWYNHPQSIVDVLLQNKDTVQSVVPQGVLQVRSQDESDQATLIGCFLAPFSSTGEVFAVRLAESEGSYSISRDIVRYTSDGMPVLIDAGQISPSNNQVSVDGNFLEWLHIDPLSLRRQGTGPETALRVHAGQTERIQVSDSLFWGKGGTEITNVYMYIQDSNLFIAITPESRMDRGTSFSFVWFEDRRNPSSRTLEFEIPHNGSPFAVLMAENDGYTTVGDAAFGGYTMEAVIDIDQLPIGAEAFLGDSASFDMYSSLTDSGVSEHFALGTVYVREIPPKNDSQP